jgi:DNA-binding MarR family transcriptional regulator
MEVPTTFPVPPEAVLDVCLCHCTRRAARALSRIYDAAFAPLGLKSSQFTLLTAIGAHAPVSVSRLSSIMLMDASTLSRNLRPLRRAGYLTGHDGAGRRAGTLELTAEGERLLGNAVAAWQTVQGAVTLKLGNAASHLLQLLDKAAQAGR